MSWVVAVGAVILGLLLLKALFDPDTTVYRCPYCNLVIAKNTAQCPRCKNQVGW